MVAKKTDDIPDQFYLQIFESIKLMFDLTSRIDERTKTLTNDNKELNTKFENINERIKNIEMKAIRDIEMKLQTIDMFRQTSENRVKMIFDLFWKIFAIVTGAFMVYKLGIG